MLRRHPDKTHQWECDRCGKRGPRKVTLEKNQREGINPPFGWCGTQDVTYCTLCINITTADLASP